jgi:hypothetical protein
MKTLCRKTQAGGFQRRLHLIERYLHLRCGILRDTTGVAVPAEESGEVQAIVRDDTRGERRTCRVAGRRHGLLAGKVAHCHYSHLNRCLREPCHTERRARGRGFREIFFPDAIQWVFVGRARQVDLRIDHVVHREPGRADYGLHIFEALPKLAFHARRDFALWVFRTLARDVEKITRQDARAVGADGFDGFRRDGPLLGSYSTTECH